MANNSMMDYAHVETPQIYGSNLPLCEMDTIYDVSGNADKTPDVSIYKGRSITLIGVLTGNINVFLPLVAPGVTGLKPFWRIANKTTGAYTVTVIGATGTGVTITQGKRCFVSNDGTNFERETPEV